CARHSDPATTSWYFDLW
nr:immunoglobulin heavy chain junction region [Macaca mulatta]MOX59820.1 immunoglobulin heavy chain junction region [Macaca mulatta]MOX59996.1 immunoglobulin heavy chain junction region [Macaca mulatta]MOX60085.1 immunoglobulin heavy chain junction region [Macaca mulatta]MOX60623.1 immunoglobulin heavy chain junction region [Macaca mulatta]